MIHYLLRVATSRSQNVMKSHSVAVAGCPVALPVNRGICFLLFAVGDRRSPSPIYAAAIEYWPLEGLYIFSVFVEASQPAKHDTASRVWGSQSTVTYLVIGKLELTVLLPNIFQNYNSAVY